MSNLAGSRKRKGRQGSRQGSVGEISAEKLVQHVRLSRKTNSSIRCRVACLTALIPVATLILAVCDDYYELMTSAQFIDSILSRSEVGKAVDKSSVDDVDYDKRQKSRSLPSTKLKMKVTTKDDIFLAAAAAAPLTVESCEARNRLVLPSTVSESSLPNTLVSRIDDPPFSTHHSLSYILEGPALDNPQLLDLFQIAACKFVPNNHSAHFPHALQQILRCVSFWNYYKQQQQQMLPANVPIMPMQMFLIWPKRAPKNTSEFLKGFLQALTAVWNVKNVPLRGKVPVVRARVDYGYFRPRPNRLGFQTHRVRDLQQLRQDLLRHYFQERFQYELAHSLLLPESSENAGPNPLLPEMKIATPTITILNRSPESGRSIVNAQKLLEALQKAIAKEIANIQFIPSMDRLSFLEQAAIMTQTDLLLSPHGAQLASLFLMPRCSAVVELFGLGYLCPEFYGSLAAASGIEYSYIYTGSRNSSNSTDTPSTMERELEYWMRDLESRTTARSFGICAPIEVLVQHIKRELWAWYQRLQNPSQLCP